MDGSADTGRIRGFDGVRALAVLLVFLQHDTAVGGDFYLGSYGVWLFFVLSGFLIVRILASERRRIEAGQTTRAGALGRFFWRRTLRIAPPYYMVLVFFTVVGGVLHLVPDFPLKTAGWYYAQLSNFYFIEVGRWVGRFGHLWSLAVEEQFYLVAAPVLLLAVPSRLARQVCAGTMMAALALALVLRTSGASEMVLYANPFTNFGALAFGGWIGLGLPARAKVPGGNPWPALACLGLLAAWIVAFRLIGTYPQEVATLISVLPFWITTVLGGLLLRALFLNPQSRLADVLEWGPVAGFGRISYGFYLYHNLLPRWLVYRLAQWAGLGWRPSEPVEAVVAFVLGLALAIASWRLVERPLQAFKDRPPRLRWPGAPMAASPTIPAE